jgi:hypothetical protein
MYCGAGIFGASLNVLEAVTYVHLDNPYVHLAVAYNLAHVTGTRPLDTHTPLLDSGTPSSL